jgi:hypothetical protein
MSSELSNKELKSLAPSIFAKEPWSGVSKRYTFIPTIDVVDAMRDSGFVPVRASQGSVRVPGKAPYTKHMVRFRSKADAAKYPKVVDGNAHHFFKNAPDVMEMVLSNAHDRSAVYELDRGIYRLVCSNGLVAFSASLGSIRVYHTGDIVKAVLENSRELIRTAPLLIAQIDSWRRMELGPKVRDEMAEAALIMRWGVDDAGNLKAPVSTQDMLTPRRTFDKGTDLWTTLNIIQENMMKGEIVGRAASGRKVTTRAIRGVNSELDINRNVWALAETIAEEVAA